MIEWRTTYFQRAGTANFEIILPEDRATLSVIYGQTADNGSLETSGIQSSDNGPFTQFSCGEATLVSGLRVNYVPTGCPVRLDRDLSIGDYFFDPADVTVPDRDDGLLDEHRPDHAHGHLGHGRLRLRIPCEPGDTYTYTFNTARSTRTTARSTRR